MALTSFFDQEFVCPSCDERYFNDDLVVYDEEWDDTICCHCSSELQAERQIIAHAERGD